ncbi:hypothetical protein D0Y65_048809 [Glycine soja]|uniref:Uncharacterized protein n=1 Tax=Glycine soja TaxID=3848 RepID=A0A445FUN2_GLYSO|nr:hypothetical protein D0Y65_048809 [Glycine soja]
MSGLNIASQAPYRDSDAVPKTTKSFARSLHTRKSPSLITASKTIQHPTSIRFLSTVSLFSVRVPVLSLQSTSMPAISSIVVILFVIAPYKNHY